MRKPIGPPNVPIPTPTTNHNAQFPELAGNSTLPTGRKPKNPHHNALKRKRAQSLETEDIEEEDVDRKLVKVEGRGTVEERLLTRQEAIFEVQELEIGFTRGRERQ